MGFTIQKLSELSIFKRIFQTPLPRISVLFIDTLVALFAWLLLLIVHLVSFEDSVVGSLRLIGQISTTILAFTLADIITRSYHSVIRLSMFTDLLKVIQMSVVAAILICIANAITYFCWNERFVFTISEIIMLCSITLSFQTLMRIAIKYVFLQFSATSDNREKVIILGSALNSIVLATALRDEATSKFAPVALLSISGKIKNNKSNGIPVEAFDKDNIKAIFEKYNCSTLVFLSTHKELIQSGFGQAFLDNGIKMLLLNQVEEFDMQASDNGDEDNRPNISAHITSIQIEDLLGREPIKTPKKHIREFINRKCVMVTGAAGSIGSEIVRQVASFGAETILLVDQAETPMHDIRLEMVNKYPDANIKLLVADIRNAKRMEQIFSQFRPEIVYHAAAYKHVPMMEINPTEAVLTNVKGTRNIANLALKYNVDKFVMISTDKAVNPTNIMGATKRIAEIYTQTLFMHTLETEDKPNATKFITTRFGNVLGSNGSVIPLFRKQIEKGGPVTVTHKDIIRYFMTIPEACSLVLEAGCMGRGGEIFLFDMGSPVKIYDLATRMISLAGFTPGKDIKIIETGLRPGEKLYEELLNDKERTIASQHEKIMIAKVRRYKFYNVQDSYNAIIKAADDGNIHEMVKQMKILVPEYKSQNSEFSSIDKELEDEGIRTKQ